MNYCKIELDYDPIYIVCEIGYTLAKSYQPHEFGEREFVEVDHWELNEIEEIRVEIFGEEIEIEVTDTIIDVIKKVLTIDHYEVTGKIIKQLQTA